MLRTIFIPRGSAWLILLRIPSIPAGTLHCPATSTRKKTAFLLTALHVLLKYAANTSQRDARLMKLLQDSSPGAGIEAEMGFPRNWRDHPLWK